MKNRKEIIVDIIKNRDIGINNLLLDVNKILVKKVSRITIIRDLDNLIKQGLVIRVGKGPAVKYQISSAFSFFKDIDVRKYFLDESEQRKSKDVFNFDIFNVFQKNQILNNSEKMFLAELNSIFQKNIRSLPLEIIKKESERLMIELSWKSSKIEGNTYDLLETEFLIKENRKAEGHTRLEAQMILNHKDALKFIQKKKIKKISLEKVKEIHNILISEMGISENIRNKPVGITGTIYKPLVEEKRIKDALKKMSILVNEKKNIFEKAILLNFLIAYIQPFNDGNKRTSRLMGNAILIAHDYCPLSFRSIDELEYKKALILFYEQNNLSYFKKLFIEQYQFAVENYFSSKI